MVPVWVLNYVKFNYDSKLERLFVTDDLFGGIHFLGRNSHYSSDSKTSKIVGKKLNFWQFFWVPGLFINHLFCQPVILSTSHFVSKSLCQLVILSKSHFLNKQFCQPVILLMGYFFHWSFCRQVILSTSHFVNQSFCWQVILSTSHFVNQSFC